MRPGARGASNRSTRCPTAIPKRPTARRRSRPAVRVAEQFASGDEPSPESVTQAEEATVRAILLVSGEENGNSTAAYAANAAYAAIAAATAGLAAMGRRRPAGGR